MTSPRQIKVGLVQMRCSPNPDENVARALDFVRAAARDGAQLVCLPELFRTPYFCQREDPALFDLAEPIPGPTSERMAAVAKELGVVVIASLFEKRAAGLYHNTAVVLESDGSILGIYRKMHIPDDPLYYEKFYFTPGDTGFRAWRTTHGCIGVLVCWDQWFPEGARLTALQGAEMLFYPTAIGWHPKERAQYGKAQHDSWEVIQRSHAVANGCYVCVPNRTGRERILDAKGKPVNRAGIQFWGQSFVASPNGQVVKRASVDKEEVIVVPCNLDEVEFSRTHWPFLRDRRVDAYGDLSRRFSD